MKYFIIGSGIWGTVIAERIASEMNEQVMVVDKRDHIGGNCHSSLDEETGIECHRYGSHIFHTSLPEVWGYLSLFGEFTSYRHKVLITHGGKVYAMPINLFTINAFYGKNFSPAEAETFLAAEIARDHIEHPTNLEECGNISAASVPILLDNINKHGMICEGKKIVLAGFGAGLTWGATVLVW